MQSIALLKSSIPDAVVSTEINFRLRLSFNKVSSVGLISKKGNNKNIISCKYVRYGSKSSSNPDDGISPNAKAALHSLLSFSIDNISPSQPMEAGHLLVIKNEKKRALQKMTNGENVEAEKIMKGLYRKFKGSKPAQIEYDAGLALVEILIHLGTKESYEDALECLDNLENLDKNLPSDAKRILYRAVLYTMLDDKEAKNYWNTYIYFIGSGPPFPF